MIERFSASVASRHMNCHASANLEVAIPNFAIPPVDEMAGAKGVGTRRHVVIEEMNKESVSDMEHMIRLFEYILKLRKKRRFKVLTEHKMTADFLTGNPMTTADLILYTSDELHILDPKTGKIPVNVVRNYQLMYYAVLAAPLAPRAKGVHLHILQPWADNLSDWYVTASELAQFKDEMIAADQAIQGGSVTFSPGDHCTFCPANPHKRGDGKGHPLCPVMLDLLYPNRNPVDEDEILAGI